MTDKRIRIILDSKSAEKNAKDLDRAVTGVGGAADRSQFSLNKLASAIAAVITVSKVKQYADAWVGVQNQLRQTTKTQEELIATSERIVGIAIESRSELEATSQLYTRFRLSVDETVLSNERLFNIVETVNKSLALSGATAQESAGALRQLSQAIASGVLRGEEFNSIAEQAPGILKAVSLETGLATGQLREFAAQGGITTDILIRALENYKTQVDDAFSRSNATISQSFEVLRTSSIQFIGNLNDATGASYALSGSIISLAEVIRSGEFLLGVIRYLEIAKSTFNATSDSVSYFSSELILVKDIGSESLSFLGSAFTELMPNVRSLIQVLTVELASGLDKLLISSKTLFVFLSNPFDDAALTSAMDKYNAEMEKINAVREDSIQLIFDERQAIISTADAASKAKLQEIADRKAQRSSNESLGTGFTGYVSAPARKDSEDDKAKSQIASAKNLTKQLKAELDYRTQITKIYRDNEISGQMSYYDQQRSLLEISIQEDLAKMQNKAIEDQLRRSEAFARAMENDALERQERDTIRAEFDSQEILATEILEQEKTAIKDREKKAREELDRAEWQSRLDNAAQLGGALMQYGEGQSKKVFKIGQKLALAQAAVALPSAVLQSFQNGGGYPWGLIPAAAMLATGLKNIQNIRSAGAGMGGGGGGGSPGASIGSGSAGSSIPTTANSAEQVQQKRIIELRGISPGDMISGEQLASIFESDDNVVVAFENARSDAQRRNVIGVTAR